MIQAEFERAGLSQIDVAEKFIIDPYRLWQQCEPRKLEDAFRRFVGGEHLDAHGAEADVKATSQVLLGMLEAFSLKEKDWKDIADICEPKRQNWIGPSRHIQWVNGVPVLTFGRHAGVAVTTLAASDSADYLEWIVSSDFPDHVRQICREAMTMDGTAFHQFVIDRFGGPPGL